MFQHNLYEDTMPAQMLANQLSHIKSADQIVFSLSPEDWATTRAWIIAPEKLPYYPKFLKSVTQRYTALKQHQSELLSFFNAFSYQNRSFWLQLSKAPLETQYEHLLNCCALSVITDHLKPSDIRNELRIIQNYLSCYVLDTPTEFKAMIELAVRLKNDLMATQGLATYLEEFETASNLPEINHPNLLTNALKQVQQRYKANTQSTENISWTQRILDAADQLSDNVLEIFKNAIPVPISAAFTAHSPSRSPVALWEGNGAELSVVYTEDDVFLKWAGPRPLKHLIQNNSPLTCSKNHTFNQNTVQYWGPIEPHFERIQFFDGLDAYQIDIQNEQE